MQTDKGSAGRIGYLTGVLLSSPLWAQASEDERSVDTATVVYHHILGATQAELDPAGGFSVFLRFKGKTILFDTGGEASRLLQNLNELGLELDELDAVVLSHNHWDHAYGIPGVVSSTRHSPPVYVAPTAVEGLRQQNPRADIVAVEESKEIAPGIWVIGPMAIEYRGVPFAEQALVLKTEDGLVVLVGCSHPGIVEIVETVKEHFGEEKIALVAGGFHLRSTPDAEVEAIAASLRRLGVEQLAPSHCTGGGATVVLRKEWPRPLLPFDLGDTLTF